LIANCFWLTALSQYWQQETNYRIDVSLNDTANTLTGFERLEYVNHSPDTLHFIWFHLWPNAYKNDRTAFSEQMLENGSTKFYFSSKEDKGYINQLDFKVDGVTASMEDHPQHIDIIKLLLPKPLLPGQQISISTPFHVKLPFNFSRGGHDGQSYQVTQWYPKPAVYDKNGWHPMPYLDQGEFYSEFGTFDVKITVPKNYVVAATGELQDADEKAWLKGTRGTYDWQPVKKKEMQGGQLKFKTENFPPSDKETKTIEFKQDRVHDFAWFADKRFIMQYDTCLLGSGKVIQVFSFYTPQHKDTWHNSVEFAKRAVRSYSDWVGEYPYSAVKVVQGPQSFGGGMEYPMITVISPPEDAKDLDNTIAHEIGHNWFYGVLATNERDHPWMDEGINSYYEQRYTRLYYDEKPVSVRILFETQAATNKDQPIETISEKFTEANYNLVAYYKTAAWMRQLETLFGTEKFDKAMQAYFRQWQFRHPQPEDLRTVLERSVGLDLQTQFSLLDQKGLLPSQINKGTRFALAFDIPSLRNYLKHPSRELYLLGPAFGINAYDKLMAGVFLTNVKLPPSHFQFFLAPMYGTGSKKMTGIGFAYYSFYPARTFQKIELGVNGSTFSINKFIQEDGVKVFPIVQKIVPGIKLTLKEKDPRSTMNRFIQFRTYLLNEDAARFYRDTVINGLDTSILNKIRTFKENSTINQLRLVIENNRILYPYRGELKIEQGKDFYRAAFTGNYFFNYVKKGGLDLRLFAGKFFYRGSKTFTRQFATDRYHLNLTGANGYEDYTYSDYFVGRNDFQGMSSQQIMVRDGAFKVRTDLLADKVGKTDDWLAAINLSSTIPDAINPLSILPVKIPLKIFLDIGTTAEGWKQNAGTDRFLYDAGIQIPLLKDLINIYIPLVYSPVFSDYIKSTIVKKERFMKKISFSIDISNFNFRKINRNLEF